MSSFDFPNIILFGDSLIEKSFSPNLHGFGAALSNIYSRRADVLNRGVAGYNSRWLLPFLKRILEDPTRGRTLLFIIMVGANDAVISEGVHHVPLSEFQQNLLTILHLIHTHSPTSKILLITPPPIDKAALKTFGPRGGRDRSVENTKAYARAVLDAVTEFSSSGGGGGDIDGVAGLDFYACLESTVKKVEGRDCEDLGGGWSVGGEGGYLTDGLHLGKEGYEILFREIMKRIGEIWQELLPENIALQMPWWGDIEEVKEFMQRQKDSG